MSRIGISRDLGEEERAVHPTTLQTACALATVMVCLPAPALAQEIRKDSVWNGVVAGAAIGGGLGVVVSKTPYDLCSARDCALLLAVAGGWLGHLADGASGTPAPVVPGQWTDDSKWNGALIGEAESRCGVLGSAKICFRYQ
jgi:hypothetical protein